jgi:hypothetical protein
LIYFGIVYKEKEIATLVCSFAKIEPMKKKDYIYCSIILFILIGSFISINDIIDSQEQSCWNMLKEIADSPSEI